MFGGYYLGQLYLGISGLPSAGSLTVQNTDHAHTVDNITLIQQHVLVVDNTTHSLTSDNLDLVEHKTLVIASASHSLVSDVISLIQQHTLVVSDAVHGLTSENIVLFQKHTLSVQDSVHDHTVDGNLVLDQYFLLNQPDPGVFLVTSPEIWVVQNHNIVVDNTMHTLVDTLTRIINWADYNKFSGIFIKDFGADGNLQPLEQELGVVIVDKTKNVDTLVPADVESGTFISDFSAFGKYK